MDEIADRLYALPPEEFTPARGKLWAMLLFCALMIPAGAFAAYAWWYEVALPGNVVLTAKAGIVGLLAIPLALLLVLVMAGLLATAKRLIIADNCVQLLSGDRVVVHVPYENVTETYASGESAAGVVGLKLHDRGDPATLVPKWTKDSYEIHVMTYGKPLQQIHHAVKQRVEAFHAGGK